MENITINTIQQIEAGAIIRVSEEMLQIYRRHEREYADLDERHVYKDLIREEEYRLEMVYRLLRALGLEYDSDTCMIIQRMSNML